MWVGGKGAAADGRGGVTVCQLSLVAILKWPQGSQTFRCSSANSGIYWRCGVLPSLMKELQLVQSPSTRPFLIHPHRPLRLKLLRTKKAGDEGKLEARSLSKDGVNFWFVAR